MWTDVLLKNSCATATSASTARALPITSSPQKTKRVAKVRLTGIIAFPNRSFLRRLAAKFGPIENTDVVTFTDNKNSITIDLQKIEPGDFITMTGTETERNHILIIHQVDYQNFVPTAIHYTHSIAWPDDGEYGHGVRQGLIEVLEPAKSLLEQKWTEKGKTGAENPTCVCAKISKTEMEIEVVELKKVKGRKEEKYKGIESRRFHSFIHLYFYTLILFFCSQTSNLLSNQLL